MGSKCSRHQKLLYTMYGIYVHKMQTATDTLKKGPDKLATKAKWNFHVLGQRVS